MLPHLVLKKYSDGNAPLYRLLLMHSSAVAMTALEIAVKKRLDVDASFLKNAALLHDIGVVKCDAPGIYCHGTEPYIRHGIIGAEILISEGLGKYAGVAKRHTGAGITISDIVSENLPLPAEDMIPVTLEEKLICYADKFYSKSRDPFEKKELQHVIASLSKFGQDSVERFKALHALFG